MKRSLTLRREALSELTSRELTSVAGGESDACILTVNSCGVCFGPTMPYTTVFTIAQVITRDVSTETSCTF